MDPLLEHKHSKHITIYKECMALILVFQRKWHFAGLDEAIRCNSCTDSSSLTCSFCFSQTTNFSNTSTAFFSSYKDFLEERRGDSAPIPVNYSTGTSCSTVCSAGVGVCHRSSPLFFPRSSRFVCL